MFMTCSWGLDSRLEAGSGPGNDGGDGGDGDEGLDMVAGIRSWAICYLYYGDKNMCRFVLISVVERANYLVLL